MPVAPDAAAARPTRRPRRFRTSVALAAVLAVLTTVGLSGCADFSKQDGERNAGPFSKNNESFEITRPPKTPPPPPPNLPSPPPGPCVDPDPNVITTCLASTSAVTPGDDQGNVTVVAERTTGKIIQAKRFSEHKVLWTIPGIDASGDGGLIDFAPSPTYRQDHLMYAFITTATDNRIVRIAQGDVAKPILTGIPKGPTGNLGSMYFRSPTELVVATGDAGNPAAANNPASLAGKILLVTGFTSGVNPAPKVLASGLGSNPALCPSDDAIFVADGTDSADRLSQVSGKSLRTVWSWPDKPGLGGCAVVQDTIAVSTIRTQRIETLIAPTPKKPSVDKPTVVLEKRYGAIGRMRPVGNGLVQFGTVNKQYGPKVVSQDDRVVRFLVPAGGGGEDSKM
ncbi:PQQ-dependent sugar dehydrogenase [Gordonia sp. X0973]|uniref:PQQ-dependent sugar dehydrogenase n=1 Tax=Gordonia sp. X0973 TaxID=2742602 RepID=UPI000F531D7B|nr:PQQ-dependent sugar dehydrogenase [Gordonia sp. X0973]QKT07792.1 PQQ-dependent sugar dehydrogenase [Gordonia sp. X0973]